MRKKIVAIGRPVLARGAALAALALCLAVVAPPAVGQTRTKPPDGTAPAVESTPLVPNERTAYLEGPDLIRSASAGAVLTAMTQASGAKVQFISASNTLVVTGTQEQIADAKATLDTLVHNAQAERERKQREKAERESRPGEASQPDELVVDFPGGSVFDYLRLIGRSAGFDGFVFRDEALLRELTLPAVTLRGSDLQTAVQIVTTLGYRLTDGREASVSATWIGPATIINRQVHPQPDPAFLADALRRSVCLIFPAASDPSRRGQSPISKTVFDLSGMGAVDPDEVQRLLDAIAIAIELDGDSPTFFAKFHEPSALLIVRGTQGELNVAREIVRLRVPNHKETAAPAPEQPESDAPPSEPAAPGRARPSRSR